VGDQDVLPGVCPRAGATVARYPQGDVLAEVTPEDAAALLE
jgi:hypothetical protein